MTTKKLVLYLYEKIRYAAIEWTGRGGPFVTTARLDDRVPDHPIFGYALQNTELIPRMILSMLLNSSLSISRNRA
ncbi:MAG: hypothetical protein DDT31_00924 [Syntrophomonadaceae bacterium]|nr:hypothetical protein [Bacillota bacterium]